MRLYASAYALRARLCVRLRHAPACPCVHGRIGGGACVGACVHVGVVGVGMGLGVRAWAWADGQPKQKHEPHNDVESDNLEKHQHQY